MDSQVDSTIQRRDDDSSGSYISGLSTESTQLLHPENSSVTHVDVTNTSKRTWAFFCIGVTVILERFAYYSLSTSLSAFSTEFFNNPIDSMVLSVVFDGTMYFLPIFGGSLADAYTGQCKGIIAGLVMYFAGASVQLAAMLLCGCSEKMKMVFFFTSICLTGLGVGAYKPNMTAFSAYQSSCYYGRDSVKMNFAWFYWVMSLGALLSTTVTSQSPVKFYVCVAVPIAILLALLFFCAGFQSYIPWRKDRSRKLLLSVCRIIMKKIRCNRTTETSNPVLRRIAPTEIEDSRMATVAVRKLWHIFPIFGVVIIFWMGYGQIMTTFTTQMKEIECFVIPNTTCTAPQVDLNMMNAGSLILFIPIVHIFICRPLRARFPTTVNMFTEAGTGFLIMAAAMVSAGVLEIYRRQNLIFSRSTVLVQMATLSLAESFTAIAGYELTYTQSPDGLEGFTFGLKFSSFALANYLCILLSPDLLNIQDRVDIYLFGVGGLVILGVILFICVTRKYESDSGRTRTTEDGTG